MYGAGSLATFKGDWDSMELYGVCNCWVPGSVVRVVILYVNGLFQSGIEPMTFCTNVEIPIGLLLSLNLI